ncbi:N-acetyltransferase family protein [Heyndrickxia sp. NPDC080065]|uniref:GNAT family N-acetyltransferase n=1 Tax=Heyndrickxia sp. NPDC080065 TaxID=3390568 RepID=UPI003D06F73C
MIETISIRKAIHEDIPDIQQVAKISWNQTYEGIIHADVQEDFLKNAYSEQSLEYRLQNTIFLVAEVNEKVAGFASFSNIDVENKSAVLAAIYLLPQFQKGGVGSKLLQHGITQLNGIDRLLVEVEKDNKIGKAFYESKGFKVAKEYTAEFFGHSLPTILMALPL